MECCCSIWVFFFAIQWTGDILIALVVIIISLCHAYTVYYNYHKETKKQEQLKDSLATARIIIICDLAQQI